jgi:hypothetical protein
MIFSINHAMQLCCSFFNIEMFVLSGSAFCRKDCHHRPLTTIYQTPVEFLSDKIVCNCKSKPFRNLYLVYLFTGTVKPKPKSKSKTKSKPVKKPKTKPTFRTVTETLSKGGTPFLKRKKRVRVDKNDEHNRTSHSTSS